MAKYSHRRYRFVYTMKDVNKILEIAKKYTDVVFNKYKTSEPLRYYTHIEDKQRYIEITTQYVDCKETENGLEYSLPKGEYCACTWKFDKTGEQDVVIEPSSVARRSNAVYKPYDIVKARPEFWTLDEEGKPKETTGPVIDFNPKYDKTEHEVYVYDLNSAYSSVLVDKIIDTYNFREDDYVRENEVGFYISNGRIETIKRNDIKCDFVFPLIDSPFKDFVTKYYNIKRNAPKGSKERTEAKNILNIMIGLWQHTNPFLRAYVVNECNERIQNLLDEDSCMWNTDAIYSVKERKDLIIGTEIGQFKLEYHGLFRQKGDNYQKVDIDETSVRGVCKQIFDNNPNWNILTDKIPFSDLKFKFNKSTCTVEENIKYKGEGKNA